MHVIYTSLDLRQNQFVLFILQLYDLTCTSINVNIKSILNIQFGNLIFFINNSTKGVCVKRKRLKLFHICHLSIVLKNNHVQYVQGHI